MSRSNIDPHVSFSVGRLLDALGTTLQDVRPGIVLSRMRSIEAIRDAFNREDGHEALFPDAIAMIDDVCLSGHDFLAIFPIVREIERQRIALGIERKPDVLTNILAETEAVQTAAAASDVVAVGAIEALTQNEPDIRRATSIEQTADLVGDKLLVIRNFASESIRSLKQGSMGAVADSWELLKPDLQDGARTAARMLAPLALIALIISIAGPVAGLAGLIRGDVFRAVHSAVSKVRQVEQTATGNRAKRPR